MSESTTTVSLVKLLPSHAAKVDHGVALDTPPCIINIDRGSSRFPFVVNDPMPALVTMPSQFDMSAMAVIQCGCCGCPWSIHCEGHCHGEKWENTGTVNRHDGGVVYRVTDCPCSGMQA